MNERYVVTIDMESNHPTGEASEIEADKLSVQYETPSLIVQSLRLITLGGTPGAGDSGTGQGPQNIP